MTTHFINGQWQQGAGLSFSSLNPAKQQLIWQGQSADSTQVNSAIEAARAAFEHWSELSFDERLQIARAFAEQLTQHKEQLALCIAEETGKALWEARTEVAAMIGKIDISVRAYQERTGSKENPMPQGRAFIRHKPHGVVAVFGPYNFPGHLPNGHIVPALLAGNAVIFKPSELTPKVAEDTVKLWQQAGIPAGVLSLLQGEVGSGKTIVALRAMLTVIDNGGQAALLAPTEVLAAQHLRTIEKLLGPLSQGGMLGADEKATQVTLITGSQSAAARREALAKAASGGAGIVIGTHALLGESVEFKDLGLIIVDEQHRFGVEQRDALKSKAVNPPHLLVMTATPIPRTVAMTVFGDLDICSLKELPQGRSPITTHVVLSVEKPGHLERGWQRAVEEVKNGHQVYIVAPRIGGAAAEDDTDLETEDEKRPPLAVLEVAPMLSGGPLKDVRVGVLHGRMSSEEKDDIMRRFNAGPSAKDGIDVLVSTTVIEVGVDVPNATMMIILDADRFGVSQLHQLRGRIGRGKDPGICLFVTESPEDSPARERLAAVASTTDGFELAQLDLEIRREGNVLGSRQSGRKSSLKLLQVVKDVELVELARDACKKLVEQDFTLAQVPALQKAVLEIEKEAETEFLEKN